MSSSAPAPAVPMSNPDSQPAQRLPWGSIGRFACFALFLACLFVPGFVLDPLFRLPQFNRFLALALFALSVDLIWGYTGLLSLGQGLYFGIGGYSVAYSLKLQKAALDAGYPRYDFGKNMALPDYMFQGQLNAVPAWIRPLIDIDLALVLAVVAPTLVATAFGWIVFRRRIKGVYFSLITQALVFAVFSLVSTQRTYTGGVDGQPGLASLEVFGYEFIDACDLNLVITTIICLFALASYALVHSKFGKILTAIRDNEYRVMALGYDTAMYKTFVFGFAGLMAGVAGALSVCATESAGPQFFSIEESILVVVYVAVGGRGTLVGPLLGALLVTIGQDRLSGLGEVTLPFSTFIRDHGIKVNMTDLWPIILGAMFIAVVLLLPDGVIGGGKRLLNFLQRSATSLIARRT